MSRLYEGADKEGDVRRERDGAWHVKLGSLVRIRLAMVAQGRRYHVALNDPIPAGFEPLNPALAMSAPLPRDTKQDASKNPWWWSRAWYEHQNMRDERVGTFTSLLYAGVYDYTYVARATTPGDFVVPRRRSRRCTTPRRSGAARGLG